MVQDMHRHARMLHGWQLAILRFALTLDNVDRLAAMAAASEIDRLVLQHHNGKTDFRFFRRTSAKLCIAILQSPEPTSAVLRQHLACIEDDRLKRTFAAAMDVSEANTDISQPAGRPCQQARQARQWLVERTPFSGKPLTRRHCRW